MKGLSLTTWLAEKMMASEHSRVNHDSWSMGLAPQPLLTAPSFESPGISASSNPIPGMAGKLLCPKNQQHQTLLIKEFAQHP